MLRSSSRFTRSIVVAAVVVAALAGASCGDDDQPAGKDARSDAPPKTTPTDTSAADAAIADTSSLPESPHPVTTAVQKLRRAFLADDVAGICDSMSASAQAEAGTLVHSTPTTCTRDVRKLFRTIEKGSGWKHRGEPRLTGLALKRDDAMVLLALGQQLSNVPFTKVDGRWRLDGFLGSTRREVKKFVAKSRTAPFLPAQPADALGDTTVEVRDANGDPCPKLTDKQYPQVAGGCEVHSASPAPLQLSVLNVFGDFAFEKCTISYRVLADRAGRTWTDTFDAGGDPDATACGDVNQCSTKEGTLLPWKGRLRSDGTGGFIHRMNMCLSTCVGSFVGDLVMHMTPEGRGWRTEPVNGGGQSGFRFDGPLTIAAKGVEIEGLGVVPHF